MSTISIVISTYTSKRLPDIIKCFASIEKQTIQPTEVILVLDPIDELVNFYRQKVPSYVKIVISSGFGLSHARNTGIKYATGDIIAFIDDDASADPFWIENFLDNYKSSQVIGVGGFIAPAWEKTRSLWLPEELDWIVGCSYKGLPTRRTPIRNPIGCNMSFRRKVFDNVGYFRTDLGRFGKLLLCNEETEFGIRALNNMPDSRIIYDPAAIVYHRVNRNREHLRYVWERSFYEGISKAIISFRSNRSKTLSTENSYLKQLLAKSIPLRLRHVYRRNQSSETLALFLSILAVTLGFAVGRVMKRLDDDVRI